jgi:ubiquinone/menaquinone biosynthesis C-methylase UbiE
MVEEAIRLDKEIYKTNLTFEVGNAMKMRFENNLFESVIFSFNGIMSIPNRKNRHTALKEINRILKKSGVFIFTTHDRNNEKQFFSFWVEEKTRWLKGIQNPQLYEFGDLITTSKNENRKIFIHVPNQIEVEELLTKNGFEVLETFYRIDKFKETEEVLKQSGECRFWVAKKIKNLAN